MRQCLFALMLPLMFVTACGGDNPTRPTPVTPPPPPAVPSAPTAESLTIFGPSEFSDSLELEVGETVQLRADIEWSDGTTQEDVEAEWRSSNATVATISETGLVTGRQPGLVNLSATAEGITTRLTEVRVLPAPGPDFTIQNVHRYSALEEPAHWIEFDVIAHTAISRLELGVRVYAGSIFVDCDQRLYDLEPGELQDELVIPSVCGLDEQWSRVRFTPPSEYRCEGCDTYQRVNVPVRRVAQDAIARRRNEVR